MQMEMLKFNCISTCFPLCQSENPGKAGEKLWQTGSCKCDLRFLNPKLFQFGIVKITCQPIIINNKNVLRTTCNI